MMKKIFILGQEGTGWSIDKDRYYTQKAIEQIDGYEITNNIFKADIIYAIWWNKLQSRSFKIFNFIFKKKIIATITNDLSHQENLVKGLVNKVDMFVYASSKQKIVLESLGVKSQRLIFNPFYVDENIFKSLNLSKEELSNSLNIDYKDIQNKVLIGSFQRDSLGSDLSKPKWQKDPNMLINIMKLLDKDKFVLLLAGPRRHYVIKQCKKYDIPYIFLGDESYILNNKDDISINSLATEQMPYLYNLIEVYIVSSKSEGGPKAIPESLLCKTKVISTDVGFSPDLLSPQYIYKSSEDAVNQINELLKDKIVQESKVCDFYSFELFQKRIKNILNKVIK
jgi:glycosyltransferase involved in cell wall biosynthesis